MKKQPNKLDDQMPLALHLSLLAKMYYGAYTRIMEIHNLERYFVVLLLLDNSSKKFTQQDLCNELLMDKVSMVRVLDYLSGKGYVERIVNPNDKRARWIALTKKAQKILPDIKKKTQRLQQQVFEGVAQEDKTAFYKTLLTIRHNLTFIPADQVIMELKKSKNKDDI